MPKLQMVAGRSVDHLMWSDARLPVGCDSKLEVLLSCVAVGVFSGLCILYFLSAPEPGWHIAGPLPPPVAHAIESSGQAPDNEWARARAMISSLFSVQLQASFRRGVCALCRVCAPVCPFTGYRGHLDLILYTAGYFILENVVCTALNLHPARVNTNTDPASTPS